MGLTERLNRAALDWLRPQPRRSSWPFDDADRVTFGGVTYPLLPYQPQPSLGHRQDDIADTYTDYARYAYGQNAAVRALIDRRRQVFSQARFRYQRFRGGAPAEFWGDASLDILDGPGRPDSGQDLMSQALQDADLAGTAVILREDGRLTCLRPDWVTIVAASERRADLGMVAPDARVVGIAYWPGGRTSGADPIVYLPGEFALFRYAPDPAFRFKGVSWLKSVVQEVRADGAATTHKLMYFENGATPSTIVSLDASITPERFDQFVDRFESRHRGALNAYRTLFLGGGADVEVVGSDLRQVDFKVTQGAGETRLAAAAGVPPIVAGFSEGLASATYSNYGQARRHFSDTTLWDLWGKMSNALESIVPPPPGSRIWVDPRGIPFLQEDRKDAADVASMQATAINTYVTAGFDPETARDAVDSGDLSRLRHTGLTSVQLQEPGAAPAKPEPTPQQLQVEAARRALVEEGVVRPTQAQIAERMGVSDRTVQRWMSSPVA